ncbi:hypothetical protein SLA2020_386560 [Shorea laevis]
MHKAFSSAARRSFPSDLLNCLILKNPFKTPRHFDGSFQFQVLERKWHYLSLPCRLMALQHFIVGAQ